LTCAVSICSSVYKSRIFGNAAEFICPEAVGRSVMLEEYARMQIAAEAGCRSFISF
jgi:hypothetical protein